MPALWIKLIAEKLAGIIHHLSLAAILRMLKEQYRDDLPGTICWYSGPCGLRARVTGFRKPMRYYALIAHLND